MVRWKITSDSPYFVHQKKFTRFGLYFTSFLLFLLLMFSLVESLTVPKNQWLAFIIFLIFFGTPTYSVYRMASRPLIVVKLDSFSVRTFHSEKTFWLKDIIGMKEVTGKYYASDIVKFIQLQFRDGEEEKIKLYNFPFIDAISLINYIKSRAKLID